MSTSTATATATSTGASTTTDSMPTVTGITPSIGVLDAGAAAELYRRAFDAQELARLPVPGGSKIIHCHLRINGGDIFLSDPFPEHGHPAPDRHTVTLHLQVDDADRWFERARSTGAFEVVMPVERMFWGDRYGQLRDRFGITWSIGGPA